MSAFRLSIDGEFLDPMKSMTFQKELRLVLLVQGRARPRRQRHPKDCRAKQTARFQGLMHRQFPFIR
jgi:hypothetical protein